MFWDVSRSSTSLWRYLRFALNRPVEKRAKADAASIVVVYDTEVSNVRCNGHHRRFRTAAGPKCLSVFPSLVGAVLHKLACGHR